MSDCIFPPWVKIRQSHMRFQPKGRGCQCAPRRCCHGATSVADRHWKGLLVIWSVAERRSGAGQGGQPSDGAPRLWVQRCEPQLGHPWMGSPQRSPCWELPGSKGHQTQQSPERGRGVEAGRQGGCVTA